MLQGKVKQSKVIQPSLSFELKKTVETIWNGRKLCQHKSAFSNECKKNYMFTSNKVCINCLNSREIVVLVAVVVGDYRNGCKFLTFCFFFFFFFYPAVIDCTVSEWGVWSECDVTCGTGMMSRTRSILNAPENGGKHCPSLVQKRGCQGFKCHGQRDRRVLRGMYLFYSIIINIFVEFFPFFGF